MNVCESWVDGPSRAMGCKCDVAWMRIEKKYKYVYINIYVCKCM